MHLPVKRFLATICDLLIMLFIIWIIVITLGDIDEYNTHIANDVCWSLISGLLLFYFPVFHFFLKKTPGKMIFKLKIKNNATESCKLVLFLRFVLRNIVAAFENIFFVIPLVVLLVRNTRLSDIVSKTEVVNNS